MCLKNGRTDTNRCITGHTKHRWSPTWPPWTSSISSWRSCHTISTISSGVSRTHGLQLTRLETENLGVVTLPVVGAVIGTSEWVCVTISTSHLICYTTHHLSSAARVTFQKSLDSCLLFANICSYLVHQFVKRVLVVESMLVSTFLLKMENPTNF